MELKNLLFGHSFVILKYMVILVVFSHGGNTGPFLFQVSKMQL